MDGALVCGAGALWLVSLGWLVGTWTLALLQPLRRRAAPAPVTLPPVSIIVPTSAVESDRSNADRLATLSSLLALETGECEIVVCVDRGQPSAELRAALPASDVRVVAAGEDRGPNAKVDALAAGVRAARNDFLLFCDDNVLVDRHHLERMLAQWGGDIGLVSAAAIGTAPGNLWGEVDVLLMNSQFARLHLAGDFLGQGGAMGKSILLRRADLERAGGLSLTGRDCCEDATLTRNLTAGGKRAVLADRPVRQPIGKREFIEVWRRHRRWLSCRRKYVTASFVCEAVFSAPVACVAGAVAFGPVAGALGSAALWCGVDCLFAAAKRWHVGPLTPFAWLMREAIFLPLWTSALFARTVSWHGRRVPVAG